MDTSKESESQAAVASDDKNHEIKEGLSTFANLSAENIETDSLVIKNADEDFHFSNFLKEKNINLGILQPVKDDAEKEICKQTPMKKEATGKNGITVDEKLSTLVKTEEYHLLRDNSVSVNNNVNNLLIPKPNHNEEENAMALVNCGVDQFCDAITGTKLAIADIDNLNSSDGNSVDSDDVSPSVLSTSRNPADTEKIPVMIKNQNVVSAQTMNTQEFDSDISWKFDGNSVDSDDVSPFVLSVSRDPAFEHDLYRTHQQEKNAAIEKIPVTVENQNFISSMNAQDFENEISCSVVVSPFQQSCDKIRNYLYDEIKHKLKLCCNPTYKCTLPCVESSNYCVRHILYDPEGNYVSCAFKFSNGKTCPNARQQDDVSMYCLEHTLAYLKKNSEENIFKPIETNEHHLQYLMQHMKIDQELLKKEEMLEKEDEFIDVENTFYTPFLHNENIETLENITRKSKKRRRVNDVDEMSSTEDVCLLNTVHCYDDTSDDDISIDFELSDPLKHADVYTGEEIFKITLEKTMRLHDLYLKQMNNLQQQHKDRRQLYLQEIKKEREILCSIKDQLQDTPEEQKYYLDLKALNSYHRHHGTDAILYKKYKEKCARASGYASKGPGFTICYYSDEDGIKCKVRALPCTKYCVLHITKDKKQLLFRECGVKKGDFDCKKPIISCIGTEAGCVLHWATPNKTEYTQEAEKNNGTHF